MLPRVALEYEQTLVRLLDEPVRRHLVHAADLGMQGDGELERTPVDRVDAHLSGHGRIADRGFAATRYKLQRAVEAGSTPDREKLLGIRRTP